MRVVTTFVVQKELDVRGTSKWIDVCSCLTLREAVAKRDKIFRIRDDSSALRIVERYTKTIEYELSEHAIEKGTEDDDDGN